MLAVGDGVHTNMEQWVEIRCRMLTGQMSKRAACRHYGIHWQTLEKMLTHSEPLGCRRSHGESDDLMKST
ncbi:MAG TPA: hypothetical protein VNQ76_08795 [Planctomicrobium sp.]|nr:hypothetical protein [Planctomicrobium sp.]